MAVLRPLKVIIDNYPVGQVEELAAENNPENPDSGNRKIPFGRELYIEQEDFMEDPPRKFFRLAPGREVRLKGAADPLLPGICCVFQGCQTKVA